MFTATLTSKGQLTIPKAVRDSLHLQEGDRVYFDLNGDVEAVMKPANKSVDEVFGILQRPGESAKTVEEINDAIRNRLRSRKA